MTARQTRPFRDLPLAALTQVASAASLALAAELTRVQATDPRLRDVLLLSLDADDELARRGMLR